MQTESGVDFYDAFVIATHGDLCTTGCPAFKGGKCEIYRKYHPKAQHKAAGDRLSTLAKQHDNNRGLVGGKWFGMTVAQLARKDGISKNEARRRKAAGHYRE